MRTNLFLGDLVGLYAKKYNVPQTEAEIFVKEFFLLLADGIERDAYVKVKEFGTFRLVKDADGGESDLRINFVPEKSFADAVNAPFACFEPVELLAEDKPQLDAKSEVEKEPDSKEMPPVQAKPVGEDAVVDVPSNAKSTMPQAERVDDPFLGQNEDENVAERIFPDDPEELREKEEQAERTDASDAAPVAGKDEAKHRSARGFNVALIIMLILSIGLFIFLLTYMYSDEHRIDNNADKIPYAKDASAYAFHEVELVEDTTDADTVFAQPVQEGQQNTIIGNSKGSGEVEKTPASSSPAKIYSKDKRYEFAGLKATHVMVAGESLAKLSRKYYGTSDLWYYIVRYNQDVIKDPDKINPGMELKIPELKEK